MPDSNVVPLYQQIKEDIKAAIEGGKYKPNEKIPAEPELSAEYSVQPHHRPAGGGGAVQRRVSGQDAGPGDLRQYAADPRKMTGGNKMESFSKTCRESGRVPGARLLDRKIVPVRADEKSLLWLW